MFNSQDSTYSKGRMGTYHQTIHILSIGIPKMFVQGTYEMEIREL